jgi:hypothetical protein
MRGKSRKDRTSPSTKQYVQIVNEHGKREYLHRFVYRMEYGDIPEDCVVHHIDEDKRNNSPENVEAKSRREHIPQAHWRWQDRAGYYPSLEERLEAIDMDALGEWEDMPF